MQDQIRVDVLVVGAGPAGCTVALNLAPFYKVLVVTHQKPTTKAVGESLPAAASRLMQDMGLWSSFLNEEHQPHRLSKSHWGSSEAHFNDSIRNLDGHGWHLDRHRFDEWMLQQARVRGAGFLKCSALNDINFQSYREMWSVEIEVDGRRVQINANWLVDATGRKSFVAKRLGYSPKTMDKLACGWMIGKLSESAEQESEIYAESEGWWYTSVLPKQQRLLAFYTDADLTSAKDAHCHIALLKRAQQLSGLAQTLGQTSFTKSDLKHGFCAANSATLPQYAGHRWLAVGDAAMSFDPLSSQGIFNSLYTGLAASTFVFEELKRNQPRYQVNEYNNALVEIWNTYTNNQSSWYTDQKRWPQSPFWLRRQKGGVL